MSLKKISLVALAVIVVCGGFAMPCQAQNTFRRQRGLRWLGQGFGDGYHRQNPGYDTSYYNPYSSHNSLLLSQSPEYMAARPVPTNRELPRRFFNGIPTSTYAAPPQLNQSSQAFPSQQFQGSFSPSTDSFSEDDESYNDRLSSGSDSRNDADADDNDFREDEDNDFREEQDDSVQMDDNEDPNVEGLDEDDIDTTDMGGLSGLNDSLSLDFD